MKATQINCIFSFHLDFISWTIRGQLFERFECVNQTETDTSVNGEDCLRPLASYTYPLKLYYWTSLTLMLYWYDTLKFKSRVTQVGLCPPVEMTLLFNILVISVGEPGFPVFLSQLSTLLSNVLIFRWADDNHFWSQNKPIQMCSALQFLCMLSMWTLKKKKS